MRRDFTPLIYMVYWIVDRYIMVTEKQMEKLLTEKWRMASSEMVGFSKRGCP